MKFSAPFYETIVPLFEKETGISVQGSRFGYWKTLSAGIEERVATEWQNRRSSYIFLRDKIDLSVALDLNFRSEGVYSEIGQLESFAKKNADVDNARRLSKFYIRAIADLSFYNQATAVCAVPPSPGKNFDLPSFLAREISAATGLIDMTSAVGFARPKRSVKSVALSEKWAALEAGDFRVTSDFSKQIVVLIDDKYQSGTTMQFVASKLYDAGVDSIYAICAVKTWRDTDNIR